MKTKTIDVANIKGPRKDARQLIMSRIAIRCPGMSQFSGRVWVMVRG